MVRLAELRGAVGEQTFEVARRVAWARRFRRSGWGRTRGAAALVVGDRAVGHPGRPDRSSSQERLAHAVRCCSRLYNDKDFRMAPCSAGMAQLTARLRTFYG
jgi:hypothetical protein